MQLPDAQMKKFEWAAEELLTWAQDVCRQGLRLASPGKRYTSRHPNEAVKARPNADRTPTVVKLL